MNRSEAEALAAVKPTTVQTIVMSKETFKGAAAAQAWLKAHDFKTELDETDGEYRARQRPPGAFVAGSFKTITLTDGVTAVIGKLKATRVTATMSLVDVSDGVERPGPGAAPVAFRIWRTGDNPTDHGPTKFTDRSAQLLLEEQATRGNLYSIDVDHMSLRPDAPPSVRKAVGWHQLEVRGGELWAVNVQWSDDVRPGLTSQPPAWRYFSPAYDVDPETDEVVSYLNTALTNNPATWNVTALASRAGNEKQTERTTTMGMKYEEIMSELAALARDEGAGDDAAKAHKALKAMMPEAPASGDEPDGDEKKAPPSPPKKDAEDKPKEDGDADDEDAKKASIAAARTVAELAAIVDEQGKQLAAYAKERERDERATLLASKAVDPKVAAVLATKPLAVVRDILSAMPDKPKRDPAAADKVTATRGAGHVDGGGPALPAEEKAKLDERMGLKKYEGAVRHEGVHQVFATLPPSQARRMLASKGDK